MTRGIRRGGRALRVALALSLVAISGGLGFSWWVAGHLADAVHRRVGRPPADLRAVEVSFPSDSGATIRGWLVEGRPRRGAVLLLHGVRADRRSMLGRARFLSGAGYTVLMIDLQAHGESGGDRITFGWLESRDAGAAVRFLRNRRPGEPVAAIGMSLGGAACLVGDGPIAVDALVLEEVYPDVEHAIADRLRIRFGPLGPRLAPLLTVQLPLRLGVALDDLRPIDRIANVRCPVLIVAGSEDRRTPLSESRRMFVAAPEPKRLWIVEGAAHVDLHRFASREYERRVLAFLATALGAPGSGVTRASETVPRPPAPHESARRRAPRRGTPG